MDDVKLIYTNGDSWTAGDIVDPEIFGDKLEYVMHPDNDQYRLPKVWPHILANKLGKEVINNSYAGCSNDGIVRKTLEDIPNLLKKYKPEDICVIIGFSSPERKDFFYRDQNRGTWDTLYPAELNHWKGENEEIDSFYKTYVTRYWNIEEYIHRFISHVLLLSNFLSSKGIKHYFFNAFYEHKDLVLEKSLDKHNIKNSPSLFSFIDNFINKHSSRNSWLEYVGLNQSVKEFYKVYNKNFIKTTFSEYLVKIENTEDRINELLEYHPTDEGHQKWAELLAEGLDELVYPIARPYFVTDEFNQIDLNNPPDKILKIYEHVDEINELDPNGYPMCRPLFSHSQLPETLDFQKIQIDELNENDHYFYFVHIHHHNALAAQHMNLLPEYVLSDLKKGRCKLVLDNTLEGDRIEDFLQELYKSIDKLKIIPENIFYITSNLVAKEVHENWYFENKQDRGKINVIPFPWNIHDIKRLISEGHLPKKVNIETEILHKKVNLKSTKTFLKVNRTGRPERNLFMLYINKENLYDNFKISFNKYYDEYKDFIFFPELDTEDNINDLKSKIPFDIDQSDSDNHGPPGRGKGKFDADLPFNPKHYRDTFISTVMCAFPFTENACHLHSSTYNPIYCGHPVLQFGPVRHLKKLKELGFKTFDKWWDESYDEIEFGWDRLKAVLKIVEELCNKTDQEILEMYTEMKDILQHNIEVIEKFDGKLFLIKELLYGDNL